MRERTVTMFTCEVCGHSSTDREKVVRCEARGVPSVSVVGEVGFLRRVESEHSFGEHIRIEWLVQVRITEVEPRGHDLVCKVEVVPWPDADEDTWHKSTLTVTMDEPESVLLDEVEFDRDAAEASLLT